MVMDRRKVPKGSLLRLKEGVFHEMHGMFSRLVCFAEAKRSLRKGRGTQKQFY